MGKKTAIFAIVAILVVWGAFHFINRPICSEGVYDEIDASHDPVQISPVSEKSFTIALRSGTFEIEPQAKYEISAKVVSKKKYSSGWNAKMVWRSHIKAAP